MKERYIIHVDMDAFFAAIEQRDKPLLKGKPVIVGADPKGGKGRGVVATCSYEARKFGIHSAMPISSAYKKCPRAVFLPPDMKKYSRVSEQIYEILYSVTPQVEMVSIDEAFLDITGSLHLFQTPRRSCLELKSKIKQGTGLTASLGLAPTKMAAKIASELFKPDGFLEVTKENLLEFLRPLEINKLWGLGRKSQSILNAMGIRTIGELAGADPKQLTRTFGKNGQYLHRLAQGIDESRVEETGEVKSMSNETTFSQDTRNSEKIQGALMLLCEQVSRRLRREDLKGKTITLKVRLTGFNTYTRSKTLIKATNHVDTIYKTAKNLLDNFDAGKKAVRLIGVKVSGLIPEDVTDSILRDEREEKAERIHKALDSIYKKFGPGSIRRATDAYFPR
jgi:nucleotidyltransferase/DNA polymerase involved in DNA repair